MKHHDFPIHWLLHTMMQLIC